MIDSNILIDVFAGDQQWRDRSATQLLSARRRGRLVINQIVYAEAAATFPTQRRLDDALGDRYCEREDLPWEAGVTAARAFLAYRRAGGLKRSPLPDLYIAAHAEAQGYVLLTRDPTRYRRAFPMLKILAPEGAP